MKKTYLLERKDIQKIRKMIRLLEKAVAETVLLCEVARPGAVPFPPAQSDLIEEAHFTEEQLELFRWNQDHSDSYDENADPVQF